MSDYIGLKLGNYHIVRLIGRGGFAHVYQGEHIYLKTPAAIKVLNMHLMNDVLEKFLQEARIIALLEHPHIVRVLEFGVEGITPFLVMNYAKNGTLRQHYPKKSTLAWMNIISYTKQVADALQYAHNHGVIHRDIKPENMLLDKNQQVQLSDFGLAVIAQNIDVIPRSSAGTTAYMAPEQLQGQPCRASDQYALGIVVYEWLSGSTPFSGSEREVTIQHLYSSPPSLNTKVPAISPAIEQVIMKALAKDPQARFATIQEFALALEQAAPSETLHETGKERTPEYSSDEQTATFSSQEPTHDLSHQQMPINLTAPSNFVQHLPLLAYESTLTNNRRILQPSLGSSIQSLEGSSLVVTSSSEEETSHTTAALPPPTPISQRFPNLATPAFLYATSEAEEKTAAPLPLPQVKNPKASKGHVARNATLAALMGIAIIGLIILASIGLWTHFLPNKSKAALTNLVALTSAVHTPTAGSTTRHHPTTGPSNGTIPATASRPGIVLGLTPIPGTHHPTPIATIGTQSTPGTNPTVIPTPGITVTPTTTLPLTLAFVDPPSTAVAGSIITIEVQASQGGVTIALNGKVRFFGQLTANRQGIAAFRIRVPLIGTRIFLTATSTDAMGNTVQSPQIIIVI
jgi:serine/threonine protein kinase